MAMFDFSDFYDWVAKWMPNNCNLVEIGVADGQSALYLAKKLHQLGKEFTLYMVDNLDYGGLNQFNTIWRNVADSGLHKNIVVIPKDSREAAEMFNGNSIHFLFLDSSHEYEETKQSLHAWYDKIIDDGYVGGHDYHLYPEIKKAVDETIPLFATREPIPDHPGFTPERILHIIETENKYGVFYFQKRFWLKLNK